MNPSTRTALKLLLIPLMALVMFLQWRIDPHVSELNKGQNAGSIVGLSNEFILGPMLGLQQAVAGALWVRADEFFHEGDYDAILPIVRMVTWLDPHQLDVYITGAWHLAYNFTDSNERSDRRYIPAAQKLLEEGFANNSRVYDIAFEIGWQNTDKIKNYDRAEKWFRTATGLKAVEAQGMHTQDAPMFVWHQLAHALERQGRIDESIAIWKKALEMTEARLAKEDKDPKMPNWSLRAVRDSEKHNYTLMLKRKFSRFTHEIDFEIDGKQTKDVDPKTGRPSPNSSYVFVSSSEIAERASRFRRAGEPIPAMQVGGPRPPAVAPKWDVAFDAQVRFEQPMVMKPSGKFNVGDGARVTIRLHDDNWREQQLKEFKFDIDQSQTIMVDAHSVRKGRWGREINMSKDPKMYGFHRPTYYLVFEFNPRGTSPFIQDKFGWSGEGMTDKRYIWVDNSGEIPNRMIRKVFRITREQVMGAKPVTDADVVPNEEYARLMRQAAVASR